MASQVTYAASTYPTIFDEIAMELEQERKRSASPAMSTKTSKTMSSYNSHSSRSSRSSGKRLERRLVGMWKALTRTARKQPRASFVPPDFVLVTKRKSIRFN